MQLFRLSSSIVNVDKHKDKSSSFTTITSIHPKSPRFMFKMFKVFVPTKPMATPQELVLL